jgi:hypothetical protein
MDSLGLFNGRGVASSRDQAKLSSGDLRRHMLRELRGRKRIIFGGDHEGRDVDMGEKIRG